MNIEEAKKLIQKADFVKGPQIWLDLGCGRGIFTLALAELLPPGSEVIGVDKETQNLPEISFNGNVISFLQRDFSQALDMDCDVDGVLMANSLHYIQHQKSFIHRIGKELDGLGSIIIIEYDSDISNTWVPYPIPLKKLRAIFGKKGDMSLLGTHPSIYRNTIYSVQLIWR